MKMCPAEASHTRCIHKKLDNTGCCVYNIKLSDYIDSRCTGQRMLKRVKQRQLCWGGAEKLLAPGPTGVTRTGSCRKTRRMLPRRRCAVREEGKSGIETVTEVLPTPEIKKA